MFKESYYLSDDVSSVVGPVGLSLLHEGGHTLLLVVGAESGLEHAAFVKKALSETELFGLVDTLLGHGDGGKPKAANGRSPRELRRSAGGRAHGPCLNLTLTSAEKLCCGYSGVFITPPPVVLAT